MARLPFGRGKSTQAAIETGGESSYTFTAADVERARGAVASSNLDHIDRKLITTLLDIVRSGLGRKGAGSVDLPTQFDNAFEHGARIEAVVHVKGRIIPKPNDPKSVLSIMRIIPHPPPPPPPHDH